MANERHCCLAPFVLQISEPLHNMYKCCSPSVVYSAIICILKSKVKWSIKIVDRNME